MITKIYLIFLIITFALHYCFVMLLLGTPVIGLFQRFRGITPERGSWYFLRNQYPICISMTITTGVAPLLFSQTLFHRNFYQSFINLYPFPLIGIVILIIFFYNSYIIQKWDRFAVPLTILQLVFLTGFVLFFSTLFQSIIHPDTYAKDFWSGSFPKPFLTMLPVHFLFGIVGSGLFFLTSKKNIYHRSVVLLFLAIPMAIFREQLRTYTLKDAYPAAIVPDHIDPSFYIFLASLIVMVVVLYKAFRIAKVPAID